MGWGGEMTHLVLLCFPEPLNITVLERLCIAEVRWRTVSVQVFWLPGVDLVNFSHH